MFRNYLKIALRNLARQRFYSLINIIGLTFGITSFLLITLYVQHETGFDRYIPKNERIFRVVEIQNEEGVGEQHVAITMGPLAAALRSDFPEVENTVRLLLTGKIPVQYGSKQFNEDNCFITDASIIPIFNIQLLAGNRNTALTEAHSVIISEILAKRYFGSVAAAMGKPLWILNKETFTVTGVMQNFPENCHLQCSMFIALRTFEKEKEFDWLKDWGNNSLITYVLLREGADVNRLETKLPVFIKRHITDNDEEYSSLDMYLQPLKDIHLHSNHIKFQIQHKQGNIKWVHLFSFIAVLVLLVACVNFINIAIARSVKRSKEVGMRKVLGANRSNLIYHFIGESLIITIFSVFLSVGLVELLLPRFNAVLGTHLLIDFVHNGLFNYGLLLIVIVTSLLSGSYPAFYLSKFSPAVVLKGSYSRKNKAKFLRKTLVVFQFSISVIMIFSVLVIVAQLRFTSAKDLGYNPKNVVGIPIYETKVLQKSEILKNEILKNPSVKSVAFSSNANGASGTQGGVYTSDSIRKRCMVRYGFVDYNFFRMMEIPLVEGRYFQPEFATDSTAAVIVNEVAVREFGWDKPLGKKIKFIGDEVPDEFTVVGVIRNYHYYSLHSVIEPAAFFIYPAKFNTLLVKINDHEPNVTITRIENIWKKNFPESPFEYFFIKQQIHSQYTAEENVLIVFIYFTFLSLVISCMGLYGLASLVLEQRTREIGIRKVVGGSIFQIGKLMIQDFVVLVVFAGVIGSPVAFVLSNNLLNNFAYYIQITVFYFIYSIFSVLLIALITVGIKAVKVASANPVFALKYE
jgi:putative ABC transport system permease protein